jgi:DNA-binding MarR family transcriptional regulator
VLLIDEPSAEIGHTLFGRLRDEVWQLPFIWVVTTDDRNRAALTRPPADAFFPVVIELDPLTYLQAAELLRNRVSNLSDADLQTLVRIAGGSPRRLLNVARDLTINERSAQQLLEEDSRRSAILNGLGESASLLLAFLEEHGASSASDNDLLEELGWTRARATQVLNQLEDAGLLVGRRQKGGRRKLYELAHRG